MLKWGIFHVILMPGQVNKKKSCWKSTGEFQLQITLPCLL